MRLPPSDAAETRSRCRSEGVIKRRSEQSRKRESSHDWRLDRSGAILNLADLSGAHFERADLNLTRLAGARLRGPHLRRADLRGAHLEGADLCYATGMSEAQLRDAHGDAATKLPEELVRPTYWPSNEVAAGLPKP